MGLAFAHPLVGKRGRLAGTLLAMKGAFAYWKGDAEARFLAHEPCLVDSHFSEHVFQMRGVEVYKGQEKGPPLSPTNREFLFNCSLQDSTPVFIYHLWFHPERPGFDPVLPLQFHL